MSVVHTYTYVCTYVMFSLYYIVYSVVQCVYACPFYYSPGLSDYVFVLILLIVVNAGLIDLFMKLCFETSNFRSDF